MLRSDAGSIKNNPWRLATKKHIKHKAATVGHFPSIPLDMSFSLSNFSQYSPTQHTRSIRRWTSQAVQLSSPSCQEIAAATSVICRRLHLAQRRRQLLRATLRCIQGCNHTTSIFSTGEIKKGSSQRYVKRKVGLLLLPPTLHGRRRLKINRRVRHKSASPASIAS